MLLCWLCALPMAAQTVSLSVQRLRFVATPGGPMPGSKTIAVESGADSLPVQVTEAPPWLQITTNSATTPARLTFSADSSNLAADLNTARVLVGVEGREALPVDVTLELAREPRLVASLDALSLTYSGGAVGGDREISVTSSNDTTLGFGVSVRFSGGAPWLTVPSGKQVTPTSVLARVSAVRLKDGLYRATIVLTQEGAAAPIEIPVTLAVNRGPEFRADPVSLDFDCYLGKECRTQEALTIRSTGRPLPVLVTAAGYSRDTIWLGATPLAGTTPLSLRVSLNLAGLAPGSYSGSITIDGDASNGPMVVPVRLNVSGDPQLEAQPESLSFAIRPGRITAEPAVLAVRSPVDNLGFWAFAVTQGGEWLDVATVNGTTPGTVSVKLKDSARTLSPGRYPGEVFIRSNATQWPRRVPVTLTVRTGPVAIPRPAQLEFIHQSGGANNPSLEKTVRLETAGDVSLTYAVRAISEGGWLSADEFAMSPGTFQVRAVPPGRAAGRQTGFLILESAEAPDDPVRIPVTLQVQNGSLITASPPALRFQFPAEGSNTSVQTVEIRSTGDPVSYDLAFSAIPFGRWLRLSTVTGLTPGSVRVEADQSNLRPGTYSGAISILVRDGNTQVIPVTLTVGRGSE